MSEKRFLKKKKNLALLLTHALDLSQAPLPKGSHFKYLPKIARSYRSIYPVTN